MPKVAERRAAECRHAKDTPYLSPGKARPRTHGRTFTNTYAGIAPASAPAFIAAQLIGGAIGTLLAAIVYPVRRSRVRTEEPAQLAG